MPSSVLRSTCLFTAMVLSGCAGSFEAYEGPALTDVKLAFIRGGMIDFVKKDGRSYYELGRDGPANPIKVEAGTYEIGYSNTCYKSPEARSIETLTLMSGHSYRAQYACGTSFFSKDYMTHIWIEDETTRQIVAGRRPS